MNSQSKQQIFLVLASVILAAFLLASCTDKTLDPIFWTIENEVEVSDDRGLEDTLNVYRLVDDGVNYYIAANQFYYRLHDGSSWQAVSPPADGAFCNTIEFFSGDIVAGFYDSAGGTGLGLWKSSNPGSVPWVRITDSNLAGDMQIVMLKEAGGYLFVSTVSTNEHSLYRTSDLITFTRVQFNGLDTVSSPINDITSDGAANYWVIAGMTLYNQAADPPTNLSTVSGPEVTKPFGGVYYSSAKNTLYLSSKDGKLFTGADWAAPQEILVDTDAVPFTTFLELDPSDASSDLFIGTGGFGYYKLIIGSISDYERRPDYNISDMYKGVVLSFYKDPATSATSGTIFVCTYGAGLWRASWNSANTCWSWKQE